VAVRPPAAPPSPPAEALRAGGTLRIAVADRLTTLDPALAETPAERALLRLTSRQLVSYDGVPSLAAADPNSQDPKPDLSIFADISDDKTRYTFRLRDVSYAPPVSRPVRAADVVFAVKRLCDPNAPSPGRGLFAGVVGFPEFCAGMAAVPTGDRELVRSYLDRHDVPGVRARDDHTVAFTLAAPAGDFLNALAMPYATPLPEEAVADLPRGGPPHLLPGLGPYAATGGGSATDLVLVRNPAWNPDSDPLRRSYPDRVELSHVASPEAAVGQVDSGAADLVLGDTPAAAVRAVVPAPLADPRVRTSPDGTLVQLLPQPGQDTPCGRLLATLPARAAIAYGVDRAAVAAALGGRLEARPAASPLPEPVLGYAESDPYATPGSAGDPARARAALQPVAGPAAVPCSVAAAAADPGLRPVVAALEASLAAAGVRVTAPAPGARPDLLVTAQTAAWRGNAARLYLAPLMTGCEAPPTAGCALAPDTAAAAVTAAAESDPVRATARWTEVAALLQRDAATVPLAEKRAVSITSARLRGFRWLDLAGDVDPANVAVTTP